MYPSLGQDGEDPTSDDPTLQRIYVSLGQENESAVYLSLNKISEMR